MSLESYNNFFNKVAESEAGKAGISYRDNEVKKEPNTTVDEVYGKVNQSRVESQGDYYASSNEKSNVDTSTFGKQVDTSVAPAGVSYHYNEVKEDPKMTVDKVYGKVNQSMLENQGDYSASSNEKSNVDTPTFGKQADISVTPALVTENKGIADNSTIQSVEGLNFQQKDKASQDVLDSRKRRDEVEAEDKSNQMRDKIKSTVTNNKSNEDVNDFQIGDKDESTKTLEEAEAKLIEAAKNYGIDTSDIDQIIAASDEKAKAFDAEFEILLKKQDDTNKAALEALNEVDIIDSEYNAREESLLSGHASEDRLMAVVNEHQSKLKEVANKNGIDTSSLKSNQTSDLSSFITDAINEKVRASDAEVDNFVKKRYSYVHAETAYLEAKKDYDKKFGAEESRKETTPVAETTKATAKETSVAETAIATAEEAINNSTNASEEEKAAAKEALDNVNVNRDKVQKLAEKLTESLDNVSDEDINAYMEAQKELLKNYEDANDKVPFFKRTDFNKQYVTAIAKANDFDVTLADGSKMSYSEFSTKMATKSPRIAAAMYNAKADALEEKHPLLAKIERNKAKMVGNWFGSKFTFADNFVRNQFNQMAETNMRATYAAYNNVLNDPNATLEQKAEARSAIDQANSLMTASAALKASTGFWSGIGDGMGDGTYGTTDPKALNGFQKTLNNINNYTKIVLGLGVTPGANTAYQNMYYLAGDKVNKSVLFNKDFDRDGFALCQEYGNSATAGMMVGAGELSTGVALMFNPATAGMGANLIGDSIGTLLESTYGVAGSANKSEDYTRAVLDFFEDAKDIAENSISVDAGNEEVVNKITSAISQIENFRLGSEEANSFDKWLEGSGSNATDGGKFNQALTYEEWLKLIEADPTMQEYAKKLIAEKKKNVKESNADTGVNS